MISKDNANLLCKSSNEQSRLDEWIDCIVRYLEQNKTTYKMM